MTFPRNIFRHFFALTFALFALILPTLAQPAQPDEALYVDVEGYRQLLIDTVDVWNGGLDGTSGMGAYAQDFNGFFQVNLDRRWNQADFFVGTSNSQSRAIYMNVEAYRAAVEGGQDGERFIKAVRDGTDYLIEGFRDDEFGGYVWMLDGSGQVIDEQKQGYGNVHPILALAHAYDITRDATYLDAALEQVALVEEKFADPGYPGGLRPNFNRNFTEVQGFNNIDNVLHYFEALLALWDVAEGEDKAYIADLVIKEGDFIAYTLYQDEEGFSDRGYLAYNYEADWTPAQAPYTRDTQWWGARHATPGHNIEIAYLFSRAAERGFNPEWTEVGEKAIRFCLEHAIDPETGGMLYDTTDYDGQPLPDNPDNGVYIWWPQTETARAMLHFMVVRGEDYREGYKKAEALYLDHLVDWDYGGAYQTVNARSKRPGSRDKGTIWTVNYHETMFYAEVLRLNALYEDEMAALNGE